MFVVLHVFLVPIISSHDKLWGLARRVFTLFIRTEQLQLSRALFERFQNLLVGTLRKTMVVKCLYVETIVPLKDLNAFKQKCFRYSIFLQTIFLMYNFIFIESSIQQMFQTSIFFTFMNKFW